MNTTSKMKKIGAVVLSVILAGFICMPVSATAALAQDAQGELDAPAAQPVSGEDATDETSSADVTALVAASTDSQPDDAATIAPEPDPATTDATANVTAAPDTDAVNDTDANTGTTDASADTDATPTSNVTTADELQAAFAAGNSSDSAYVITLASDIVVSQSLSVNAGRDITINGNGHTITLDGNANISATGAGATLSLAGALDIDASPSHTGTMLIVDNSATLDMDSGVSIIGNDAATATYGGGVSVTDKATFNMNGGMIESCAATTGGGVYVGASATFNMTGDAIIQDCNAYGEGTSINGCGAGVFLNRGTAAHPTTMNMSGSAIIRNNNAQAKGGGIFVENISILNMQDDATIWQNSSHVGGGVMNYGRATMTTIYDNSAVDGGDDICTADTGKMALGPTNPDWVLSKTKTHVTGWYYDGYHKYTDENGDTVVDEHRWVPDDGRNNPDAYTVEYVPTAGFTDEQPSLKAGAPIVEKQTVTVLWENQDGEVLYKMSDVDADAIPTAGEYNELSGNADPTEPDTPDGYSHEFTGWFKTQPTEGQVVYIANYKLIAPQPVAHHVVKIHYVDENNNVVAPAYEQDVNDGEGYSVPSPHVDGYTPDKDAVAGTMSGSDVDETVTYHKDDDPSVTPHDGNGTPDERTGDNAVVDDPDANGGNEMTPSEAVAHYGAPGDNARTASDDGQNAGTLVQTGDSTGIAIAGLLGAAAMASIVLVATARKRRQR